MAELQGLSRPPMSNAPEWGKAIAHQEHIAQKEVVTIKFLTVSTRPRNEVLERSMFVWLKKGITEVSKLSERAMQSKLSFKELFTMPGKRNAPLREDSSSTSSAGCWRCAPLHYCTGSPENGFDTVSLCSCVCMGTQCPSSCLKAPRHSHGAGRWTRDHPLDGPAKARQNTLVVSESTDCLCFDNWTSQGGLTFTVLKLEKHLFCISNNG